MSDGSKKAKEQDEEAMFGVRVLPQGTEAIVSIDNNINALSAQGSHAGDFGMGKGQFLFP